MLLGKDSVGRLRITWCCLIWLLGTLLRCFYFDAGQVNHRFSMVGLLVEKFLEFNELLVVGASAHVKCEREHFEGISTD